MQTKSSRLWDVQMFCVSMCQGPGGKLECIWGSGMSGRDIMLIQEEREPGSLGNSELKSYKYVGYKDQDFISLYFLRLLKYNISIIFDIY